MLHGDGTDLELLEGESIGDRDVTVCVTNNDEKNLLCSLLVKQLGCKRIITRVGNMAIRPSLNGWASTWSCRPRDSALKELLNRFQAKDVNILALVEGGQGEVLRLNLPEDLRRNTGQGFQLAGAGDHRGGQAGPQRHLSPRRYRTAAQRSVDHFYHGQRRRRDQGFLCPMKLCFHFQCPGHHPGRPGHHHADANRCCPLDQGIYLHCAVCCRLRRQCSLGLTLSVERAVFPVISMS